MECARLGKDKASHAQEALQEDGLNIHSRQADAVFQSRKRCARAQLCRRDWVLSHVEVQPQHLLMVCLIADMSETH